MTHVSCTNIGMPKKLRNKKKKKNFEDVCDWFFGNKLSVDFGEDKTKSILLASKRKIKCNKTKYKL